MSTGWVGCTDGFVQTNFECGKIEFYIPTCLTTETKTNPNLNRIPYPCCRIHSLIPPLCISCDFPIDFSCQLYVRREVIAGVVECMTTSLTRLQSIWSDIGIKGEKLQQRYGCLSDHVSTVLSEMIAKEEGHRKNIVSNIDHYRSSIRQMSVELGQRCTMEVLT